MHFLMKNEQSYLSVNRSNNRCNMFGCTRSQKSVRKLPAIKMSLLKYNRILFTCNIWVKITVQPPHKNVSLASCMQRLGSFVVQSVLLLTGQLLLPCCDPFYTSARPPRVKGAVDLLVCNYLLRLLTPEATLRMVIVRPLSVVVLPH